MVGHTREPRRLVVADFSRAFQPEYNDDEMRLGELAYPPNSRKRMLRSEASCGFWFHSEVSNIAPAPPKVPRRPRDSPGEG